MLMDIAAYACIGVVVVMMAAVMRASAKADDARDKKKTE